MLPRALSASGKRLTKFGGGSWERASGGAEHLGLTLLWRPSCGKPAGKAPRIYTQALSRKR